jgi:hypothetical protein
MAEFCKLTCWSSVLSVKCLRSRRLLHWYYRSTEHEVCYPPPPPHTPLIYNGYKVGHGSDRNCLTVYVKSMPKSAVCNCDVEIIISSHKDSGGSSHRGVPCSVKFLCMYNFWWTKGHWDRFFFLVLLQAFPGRISSAAFYTRVVFIYHRCYVILAVDSVVK